MPRANYSTSMANIFEAQGGAAGIFAQGEDREVYARLKHGARHMQQAKHMDVGKCAPNTK